MKNKKLSFIISFFTLIILVSSPLLTVWVLENQIQDKNELVSKEQKLMTSQSWVLTNPILIDDSDPSKNWSKTANDNDWCSGSGIWNDPYVVKHIWMNSSNLYIEVRNSNVYFEIWNCSLFTTGDYGIALKNVNNSKIFYNNISVNGFFGKGIFLSYSNNNSIDNNFIWDSDIGIQILNGSKNWMTSNLINDCASRGIEIEGSISNDCFIFNNSLINNMAGVYLHGKAHELFNNTFKGCGIVIGYNREEVISYNIDSSNTLNNKPIYYYANKTNLSPMNFINAGQILLANCNDSKFADLSFTNTVLPILMVYSSNNEISNISIMNEIYGMGLYECEDNTIRNNEIKHCGIGIWTLGGCNNNEFIENRIINTTAYGIRLASDDNNLFFNNLFKDNQQYGLSLSEYSEGNLMYKNIFLNNSEHAYDESVSNYWDNGSLGNYWDDYIGLDLNGDGIGDTPYKISGNMVTNDNYPIFSFFSPVEITILKPSNQTLFGQTAPEVNISVDMLIVDLIWYQLNNGTVLTGNYSFTGIINQNVWNLVGNGSITIIFYANDTFGNLNSSQVIVRKDIIAPVVTIISPAIAEEFEYPPIFNITINEANLDEFWYTIDTGANIYTITMLTGTINQTVWDATPDGHLTLTFYAKDKAGNIGVALVIVTKLTTYIEPPPGIPGYDLIALIAVSLILTLILVRKKFKK